MSGRQADTQHDAADHVLDEAVTRLLAAPEGAPATPPDRRALVAYSSWLAMERRYLCRELYPHLGHRASEFIVGMNAGFDFHRSATSDPSSRAVAMLAAIGCDWTKDGYLGLGDSGDPVPQEKAFPHPDARLIDLEQDFLAASAAYTSACDREEVGWAERDRREEPYREANRRLLLHPEPHSIFWTGDYLRSILSGRSAPLSAQDAAVIGKLRRAQLVELLPLVEARDARREALALELRLEVLEADVKTAFAACAAITEEIYRLPAKTVDGLALKVRVLKLDEPGFWQRPDQRVGQPGYWHEAAFAEIADGVEYLLATGQARPRTATPSDLARACVWAIRRRAEINRQCSAEGWCDEQLDRECQKVDDVFTRAIQEPSQGLGDIIAKAQLALNDYECFTAYPGAGLDDGKRIVLTVLREVAQLAEA
ncbi:hypothetical protein ASG40_16995 [Methylobacterium sp. Leaf399]|nr:hypothetical protein ASG40_16995 [Methylobacterium sp. Leaf399]